MNAAELAALIAAVAFAVLVCVGVFVLFRLGRFLSEGSKLMAETRERGGVLLDRAQAAVDGAQAAVDRADRQLDHSASVTASMTELGDGMSELAGQVSALTGGVRAIASGPVGRVGAVAYGIRHAVSLRRSGRRTVPGRVVRRTELAAANATKTGVTKAGATKASSSTAGAHDVGAPDAGTRHAGTEGELGARRTVGAGQGRDAR
jgi:X-X-X-Leu-X-X-Gly heptad repeat protein